MAAGGNLAASEVNVDVVPVAEGAGNLVVAFLVDGFEAIHRLIGKDDAPAESIVRPVALDHRDFPRGIGLPQKDGHVQSRGPAAEANDPHWRAPFAGRDSLRRMAIRLMHNTLGINNSNVNNISRVFCVSWKELLLSIERDRWRC